VIDTPTDLDDDIGPPGVDAEEETNVGTTGVAPVNDDNIDVETCHSSQDQLLNAGKKRPMEDEYQYFQCEFDPAAQKDLPNCNPKRILQLHQCFRFHRGEPTIGTVFE